MAPGPSLSLSECLDEKRKKVSLGQFYETFFLPRRSSGQISWRVVLVMAFQIRQTFAGFNEEYSLKLEHNEVYPYKPKWYCSLRVHS